MPQLRVEGGRMEQQRASSVVSALRWCQCHRWAAAVFLQLGSDCAEALMGTHADTFLYKYECNHLNADSSWTCPSSVLVPPQWVESVWTAKSCVESHFSIQSRLHGYVLQYLIIWSLRKEFASVAITVSELSLIQRGKAVTLEILAGLDVAGGSKIHLEWISSLAREIIETFGNKWEGSIQKQMWCLLWLLISFLRYKYTYKYSLPSARKSEGIISKLCMTAFSVNTHTQRVILASYSGWI